MGTSTANGGAISFTGPTGVKTQHTVSCAAGAGGGTGTGGVITVNDGNASITSGGANDGQTNVASYTGGSFVKLGTGNFNLGRAGNTWTGSTTLTAGTLTLGVSNTLDNSTQIVFNGGSLSAPYDETVGTMKVDKYSVLYLSTGNHTLTFAASAGITWSGGNLSVRDWLGGYNGTLAGGSDPKLKIGTGNNVAVDLTAAQLVKVFFHRTSNTTNYTSTQTLAAVTGEVVPTATLPVELLSFSAEKDASSTIISWATASEINSDYFELRRAGTDMRWETIAKMKAAGNSAKILKYRFDDSAPLSGVNYYQLSEFDFDGAHQVSKIVELSFDKASASDLLMYPNPSSDGVSFEFNSEQGGAYYLKAFNIGGDQVYKALIFGIVGENRFKFSMRDFSVGVYSFQLFDGTGAALGAVKVVKMD